VKRPASRQPSDPHKVGEDLAGALHEVSNTLTVVLGWLDAAKSQVSGAAHEAIDVALSHARLGHDIARRAIGAEVETSAVTRSSLSVARDARLGVAQEAARRGVRVAVQDHAAHDLLVNAAPVAQQILINLLLNAVHFTPAGGSVALVVEAHGDCMRFRVVDAGPGIDLARVPTLFQSPDSTRPGGAGIGLRHAHALAEQHGGKLTLARTDSTGSEFTLDWPVGDAPSRTYRSVPPLALDGMRVLLLEDEPAVQALVDLGLSSRGATVCAVSTLDELERMLQRGVFDVALLDLSPLGKNPADGLALIARRQQGLPVVVISGSVAPDVDSPTIAAWVRKPFEVSEIVQALVELARR